MKAKILLTVAMTAAISSTAMAAPEPILSKRSADCYVIENGKMGSKTSCQVSTEKNGLSRSKNVKINNRMYHVGIVTPTPTEQSRLAPQKASFSVDGIDADYYLRDAKTLRMVSLGQLTDKQADGLSCYKSIVSHICHS